MTTQPFIHVSRVTRMLTREELLTLFPFGPSALYLDSVEVYQKDDDVQARGQLRVTTDLCKDHFLGHPILPGHLMVEVASQVAGAILLVHYAPKGDLTGFGARFTGANFRVMGEVPPGEILFMDVRIEKVQNVRRGAMTMVDSKAVGYANGPRVFRSADHGLVVVPGFPLNADAPVAADTHVSHAS